MLNDWLFEQRRVANRGLIASVRVGLFPQLGRNGMPLFTLSLAFVSLTLREKKEQRVLFLALR